MLYATLIDRSVRRTHRIVISALLIATIVAGGLFLFSGCEVAKDNRVTAPIIATRYVSTYGNYMVMLEGKKVIIISQTRFRVTIDPYSEPTLTFSADSFGNIKKEADYEFTFASHEQTKEYLWPDDAQIYAETESNRSNCFISTITIAAKYVSENDRYLCSFREPVGMPQRRHLIPPARRACFISTIIR